MYENNKSDAYSLPVNKVRAVTEDKWGNIWVGTSAGLCRLKPDESGFIHYSHLNGNEINCIAADDQGLLWIGSFNGLYVHNIQAGTFSVYTHEKGNHQSLSSKLVRCIFIDKQGIYWFGTFQGGICKYDTRTKKYISYLTFKSIEDYLPSERFIKTHKSYIVSAARIDNIDGNDIRIGEHHIPISRTSKDEVMEKLLRGRFLKR